MKIDKIYLLKWNDFVEEKLCGTGSLPILTFKNINDLYQYIYNFNLECIENLKITKCPRLYFEEDLDYEIEEIALIEDLTE